jgi:hypothetical protein
MKYDITELAKTEKVLFLGVSARHSGKRSGKDTVAEGIVQMLNRLQWENFTAVRRSLADSLKEACRNIFLLTDEQLYGAERESLTEWDWPEKSGRTGKMTAREILQWFGTEIMRENWAQDIWIQNVKVWGRQEQRKSGGFLVVVVPDIRYCNEAEFVHVLTDVFNPVAQLNNKDGHISETSAKDIPDDWYDANLVNDGTKDEILQKAQRYALQFFGKLPVEAFVTT